MRKLKRRKVTLEFLEEQLAKYGRRIQRISDEAYKIRCAIEEIKAIPEQKPFVKAEAKKEKADAIPESGTQSGTIDGATEG